MNWLEGFIGKKFTSVAEGFASKGMGKMAAHGVMRNAKMALGWAAATSILGPGTPSEKIKNFGSNALVTYMTLGMGSSFFRQNLWAGAAVLAPHFGSMARGVVQGYRGALESRTSLAIPFSHSNLAMDQAANTLAYSQSRLNDSYSSLSNQAGFMAARYMVR